MRFVHDSRAQRVVFARAAALPAILEEAGAMGSRIMLIASRREDALAAGIAASLEVVHHHTEVVRHVPLALAERAREAAVSARAEVLVSVGGGSATGLAKAVALTSRLPILAVPTTYAGSEATDVWGLTAGDAKTTGADPVVLPRTVVYDATLLAGLPAELAVASGLNALAHGIDAMWGPRADPIDRALAAEGIRAVAAGLPGIAGAGSAVADIEQTLYGGYLAAVAFASAGSGMHHKICHVLGGMFDLPHAPTHAVVLPHVLGFNAPAAAEAEQRIAQALGAATAVAGLATLCRSVRAPVALRDLGMPEDGIRRAIPPILDAIPASNPAPVTPDNLAALLRAAWEGAPCDH
ncbi:maleylacetate reductase [Nocardioides sp.]|uniref:maleylacetate reductase n=1 Tax=Nocardioides sp. TaxID=35761 RepID=UPI0039E302B2